MGGADEEGSMHRILATDPQFLHEIVWAFSKSIGGEIFVDFCMKNVGLFKEKIMKFPRTGELLGAYHLSSNFSKFWNRFL